MAMIVTNLVGCIVIFTGSRENNQHGLYGKRGIIRGVMMGNSTPPGDSCPRPQYLIEGPEGVLRIKAGMDFQLEQMETLKEATLP
jgi:hypothetical protein